MTTHLSTRLVWHDRAGMDAFATIRGAIVPASRCGIFGKHRETTIAKRPMPANGWASSKVGFPPALVILTSSRTSRSPSRTSIRSMDAILRPSPKRHTLSRFFPSPYRWMREENFRQIIDDENLEIAGPSDPEKTTGWIYEANRQIKLLDAFCENYSQHHRSSSSMSTMAILSTRK